ncbi:uncharacterized protein LOC143509364 [Brachyhypopomus gauderio]|uniref:uncharacterized protein LOC143509364 n=1 Tax=Brachyhypopomus gauderio TaxID=698409 RepID=UPI004041CC73
MKLPLGFAFAVLLTLQNFLLVSAQITSSWRRNGDANTQEDMFSGDDGYTNSNQSSKEIGQASGDSSLDSYNSTTVPLETTDSTDKDNQTDSTSDSVFPTPSPSMNNETGPDHTSTLLPENSSTGTQPSPSNETDTFEDTRNSSSTGDKQNMTTTHLPSVADTTMTPSEGTSKGTSPGMTTFLGKSPKSPTTIITTSTLLDTVSSESTAMQSTKSNVTGGLFDVREGSERGLSSDTPQNTNNHAWGAILGIAVVVGITALVVFVIMKWKNHRDFSHRKLVEDTPGDPVLRLDNSEPLNLKFDGFAYYNPGLQGDNIQMTNFPQGHFN